MRTFKIRTGRQICTSISNVRTVYSIFFRRDNVAGIFIFITIRVIRIQCVLKVLKPFTSGEDRKIRRLTHDSSKRRFRNKR